jgi:hypothetical protein
MKWARLGACRADSLALSPQPDCVQGGLNRGASGRGYGKLTTFACSCSALEHDHKLFPRPLNAIIDLGNTNPDLGGSHRGMGVEIGAGLSGNENRPQLSSAPSFNNLIIVNKRAVVNTERCNRGVNMFQPHCGKAVVNESNFPFIVELAVPSDELDVQMSRRIMDFHRSQSIQARHGRRIVREGEIYFRWCFCNLATACAFAERFGGEVLQLDEVN